MAISRQKEARSRDYALLLFRMTSRVLYSAQYHRHHCTLQAFEQFGALYICTTTMTNIRPHRDSNLVPPGYKPQSIRMSHRGRPGPWYGIQKVPPPPPRSLVRHSESFTPPPPPKKKIVYLNCEIFRGRYSVNQISAFNLGLIFF